MGCGPGNRVECAAGTWTRIITCGFVQCPQAFEVRFESLDGGPIEGEYRELKSIWILPASQGTGSLSPTLLFQRGYFHTFYAVEVNPSRDVIAVVA